MAASLAKRSERGVTLGDKVFGHVAGGVLLPYYMSWSQQDSSATGLL